MGQNGVAVSDVTRRTGVLPKPMIGQEGAAYAAGAPGQIRTGLVRPVSLRTLGVS